MVSLCSGGIWIHVNVLSTDALCASAVASWLQKHPEFTCFGELGAEDLVSAGFPEKNLGLWGCRTKVPGPQVQLCIDVRLT